MSAGGEERGHTERVHGYGRKRKCFSNTMITVDVNTKGSSHNCLPCSRPESAPCVYWASPKGSGS